jgi:tetratricopeptide (TPR) repeat protein
LATTYDNLGALCIKMERLDEAEVAFQAAAKLGDQLAKRYPQTPAYILEQAAAYANLGQLAVIRNRPLVAKECCSKTIAILAARSELIGTPPDARRALQNAYFGLAESLGRLGEHREAVKHWEKALAIDDGKRRNALLFGRAAALARSGNHRRAADEVKQLQASAGNQGDDLYHLASVLAIAASAAAKESPPADAADDYARQAIDLLRRAQAAGYFREASAVKCLRGNPDFRTLQQRADYRAWMDKL